jgi:hypothetical protein
MHVLLIDNKCIHESIKAYKVSKFDIQTTRFKKEKNKQKVPWYNNKPKNCSYFSTLMNGNVNSAFIMNRTHEGAVIKYFLYVLLKLQIY